MASDQAPMVMPLSTQSATARAEFLRGVHDFDIERPPQMARQHFDRAIAADPNFALGHLYAAYAAPSVAGYRNHLDEAVRLAPNASPAEQLLIRTEQKGLDNDVNGQMALAQQMVQMSPSDPRAYGYLAGVQLNAGRRAEARATLDRATQIDPNFTPSWIQLGNSYLLTEPRDVAKSESYIRRAMALQPDQPFVHDYMGDVYRAENNLPQARAEYTRMIELDPSNAGAYQQRGHVNSFLGNFSEARSDYDRAVALADPTQKPGFAVYHAYVNVYADDPSAAEAELERIAGSVDAMNIPNAVGSKIGAYSDIARIALHKGHLDVAQRAVDQLRTLYREQSAMGRTDAFRRGNEANIDYWEGMLAARRGDFVTARSKAQDMMAQVAQDQSPRKNEGAHELLGMADLLQKNYEAAAGHFAEANPDDIYVAYQRALALEGAGRNAEAQQLFRRVAGWNFNGSDTALVKREAARKVT
ncbi:MAG: tetratricopeptide repeat protein [Gemmatimonadales bacterium]|nr:tetratricopeptide repeat protein [Gemmatimonadales bacterium]